MALQGTLETFSVSEVLRLLAGTAKTGLMALDGDRGRGKVWLEDGAIVAALSDAEPGGDIDATLFDLLRFDDGHFVFEPEATAEDPGDPVDVEGALGRAETMLAEWKDVVSVVPSLDVGIRLVREIEGDAVSVTATQWQALAAVGSGTTPAALRRRFELTEMDVFRRVRDLVDSGLVELGEPDEVDQPEHHAAEYHAAGDVRVEDEPTTADGFEPALSDDEIAGLDLAGFVHTPTSDDELADESGTSEIGTSEVEGTAPIVEIDDGTPGDSSGSSGLADLDTPEEIEAVVAEEVGMADEVAEPKFAAETAPIDESHEADAPHEAAETDETDETDGEDFLSQLASLSPKAAAAVEATAEEAGDRNGRDLSGTADPDAGDEEINRNLLLKFLSSTKQ